MRPIVPPSVLCVDDRPQVLALRKAVLEPHYRVEFAADVHAAVALLERTSVSAVVVEYKLEGMDAEAIAYLVKQRFPHLPIILLSGYSELPQRILWLVDAYVMRSEMPHGLVRILEKEICNRELHASAA